MSERYDPSEEQIEKLIAERTPRELAIGYLRATRRARQAEAAFKVMDSVSDMAINLAAGDLKGATKAAEEGRRRAANINEHVGKR